MLRGDALASMPPHGAPKLSRKCPWKTSSSSPAFKRYDISRILGAGTIFGEDISGGRAYYTGDVTSLRHIQRQLLAPAPAARPGTYAAQCRQSRKALDHFHCPRIVYANILKVAYFWR